MDVPAALDETLSLGLELEQAEIGLTALADHDTTRPKGVQEKVAQADGAILGPVSHYEYPPRNEGGINPSAELRTAASGSRTSGRAAPSRA